MAAPRYFSGAITLGGLMQTASAFGQVRDALSWFVEAYTSLASWKATVDRLLSFRTAMDRARSIEGPARAIIRQTGAAVSVDNLALTLPDGRSLWQGVSLSIAPGEAVLLTGPSGSGKSTLLRAVAGLWPFGEGEITIPDNAALMFLPQKPYLPIDTLRMATCYPSRRAAFTDAEISGALADCGLEALSTRLDDTDHWTNRLSPGEQQRVAFARALLHRPDWLFLDEATSAIDEESELALYRLLRQRLSGAALISVSHHSNLRAVHDREIDLPSLWTPVPISPSAG